MHITGMTIAGIPPFTEPVEFEFDERVNVFVGPNATGKSTLMREMSKFAHHVLSGEEITGSFKGYSSQCSLLANGEWRTNYMGREGTSCWEHVPWIQICETRLGLSELRCVKREASSHNEDGETITHIFRHAFDMGIFDANRVEKVAQLLYKEAGAKLDSAEPGYQQMGHTQAEHNLENAIRTAHKCIYKISPEIIVPSSPFNLLIGSETTALPTAIMSDDFLPGMAVSTVDTNVLAVKYLSTGTQSSLLWIRYTALQMLYHYGFMHDWEAQPAILLIDEIENHLHPTWQRRVIPALLEHFPGLQIFATTHSPFVVAGLKSGQVHMLKREENGVITASTNEQDIIGWTTDEILRTFMGVDEPTDQLTINRRERLLELRRKDSLSDAETAEMEDLRRQVNEDFLSSSTPLEAQRERYGDMMLEFLRSRQSELSQDGV